MNSMQVSFIVASFTSLAVVAAVSGESVGTAFTYQGLLEDEVGAVSGPYDFRFALYDDSDSGSQVGGIVEVDDLEVTNGLFTVILDFGDVFDGTALWLEIGVRPGGSTEPHELLSERQALTASPYALNTAGGAGDPWFLSGNNIYYTDGSVGIGTSEIMEFAGDIAVKGTLPTPRGDHSCATHSLTGKIYCLGGYNTVSHHLSDIVAYDPANNTISTMSARLPTGRLYLSCAASHLTQRIYCFGGSQYGSPQVLDEIVEYSPVADGIITQGATLPAGQGFLGCVEAPNMGKIYCFGGRMGESYTPIDQILQYDPVMDVATVVSTTLPGPTYGLSCVYSSVTGDIYCFGGTDILKYDPISDVINAIPSTIAGSDCAEDTATGKIHCAWNSEIVEFDVSTEVFVRKPTTVPSWGPCAASSVTGGIYAFGGSWSGGGDKIVEYLPSSRPLLLQVGDPGDGTGATANTWRVFSSRVFKKDINGLTPDDYGDVLAKLIATDVVRFRYIDDPRQTIHLGVIAEDAPAEILGPNRNTVSLADYTSFLMSAVKGQHMVIEEQGRRIAEMQAELARTQARLEEVEAAIGASVPDIDRKEGAR